MKKKAPKIFVLDTNILISSAGEAIFGFDDNDVIITTTTLEELDSLKNSSRGDVGYNAREAARAIYSVTNDGTRDLSLGVKLDNGGTLKVEPNGQDATLLPAGMSLDKADNRILSSTKYIARANESRQTILVTNDLLMKIKAISSGIQAQGYHNSELSTDEVYMGYEELWVNDGFMHELYSKKILPEGTLIKTASEADNDAVDNSFVENEYLILKSYEGSSALAFYRNGFIELIEEDVSAYGITPKNARQRFALHALMSDIPLVILSGVAGSGKTLLATAAGMDGVFREDGKDSTYNALLYTRNNVLFDEDIGYLPGDENAKMSALARPFMDNLERLLRMGGTEPMMIKEQINDFINAGLIKIESMAFMRGRSIYNNFIVIDEAQNATQKQVRGICTRPGERTKIVLCGDPSQIDNPGLSSKNNGLVFASQLMKGSRTCAQISFLNKDDCVRSELAKEAAERLVVMR